MGEAAASVPRGDLTTVTSHASSNSTQMLASHLYTREEATQRLYNRSKSSIASRYFMMFFLILEESTQVTKSSMFLDSRSVHQVRSHVVHDRDSYLVTKKAGSVTTSVPTLTWPCSINLLAVLTCSDILSLVITTPNLRLQKAETVIFLSTSLSLPLPPPPIPSKPMSWSFSSSWSSCLRRNGVSGGRRAIRCARWRSWPARRL